MTEYCDKINKNCPFWWKICFDCPFKEVQE